jgi:glycosyltransferase involved in cell wall biosynthesis
MLTIVIPSYNHVDFILECLAAALAVDVAETQILVVDDGSSDGTLSSLEKYISDEDVNGKIKVISKPNSGLVSSLNLALELVKTEFVYFVASDDVLQPTGLAELLGIISASPKLGFVIGGGDYLLNTGALKNIYKKQHAVFFNLKPAIRDRNIFLDYPAPILIQSSIFRTSELRAIGGWDKNLHWDDYPIFVKMLRNYRVKDEDFKFLPEIKVIKYRQHEINSYKNTIKQYGMVSSALKAMAPLEIQNQAVGRALSYYIIVSIKSGNIAVAYRLLRAGTFKQLCWCIWKLPSVALVNYIRSKT